ncbi:MAG: hypothetical protein QOG53_1054 [Frankiales bacterium]|nr:hypothetical protein [Frankiales bacterium]
MSPTRKPSPTPLTDIPANHKDFGYLKSVKHSGGKTYLVFDRAIFYSGDAANAYAGAHGMETPVPNDYVIVNENKKLRTLLVSPSVQLFESIAMGHAPPDDNVKGPFSDLEKFLTDHPDYAPHTPFNLHYDASGRVDRIQEQFVP